MLLLATIFQSQQQLKHVIVFLNIYIYLLSCGVHMLGHGTCLYQSALFAFLALEPMTASESDSLIFTELFSQPPT